MALTALIGPASKLLGKFIKDKDKQMQLAHDLSTMAEKHAQELDPTTIARKNRSTISSALSAIG